MVVRPRKERSALDKIILEMRDTINYFRNFKWSDHNDEEDVSFSNLEKYAFAQTKIRRFRSISKNLSYDALKSLDNLASELRNAYYNIGK